MLAPAIPIDEIRRLQALRSLKVLDTQPEERFDRITRLAARLFDVPIALVSLVDQRRQWFKSRLGLDTMETGRDVSFCAHAILREGPMIVPDSLCDQRFADNPLVTHAPSIRFYAGQPIHAPDGTRVGTLCVMDHKPRQLSEVDVALLADVAAMVDREFSLLTLATVDELTRLTNRRGFTDIAPHVLEQCRRSAAPATLILIDLNGFKAINDSHGHATGDETLRAFAALLLKHFHGADLVARLGGDEFCVLTGGASRESMLMSLAAFGQLFNESAVAQQHPFLSWTAGIVSNEPDFGVEADLLLAAADRQMYEEKGRDRERPTR